MILTRCGFPGIQRYGSAMWSGDVGNDWETFRRQIVAGLGMQAAGMPWWTYDAGGFFRPGNQYSDQAYIRRMLRWIETSVYLPLMRVHGYMSDTEPWRYGNEAQTVIGECLRERYRLLPYVYSYAAGIAFDGGTLMRPLVFDFSNDAEALRQQYEYMFGRSLLVSPVTEPDVTEWSTYLPKNEAGWYDFRTNRHYAGGKTVRSTVDETFIPVFVRGGSILPYGPDRQSTVEKTDAPLQIRVYTGADATFTLYEDDGHSNAYEQGAQSRILLQWDDARRLLTIGTRKGSYPGMAKQQRITVVVNGKQAKDILYKGKKITLRL
jgi:alpha-D-xyloside xylohydrolase